MRISDQQREQVVAANEAGKRIAITGGFEPISPLDGEKGENWEWKDHMLDDLQKLSACDAMLVLCTKEEAKTSFGVQIEILWAKKLGLPISYVLTYR